MAQSKIVRATLPRAIACILLLALLCGTGMAGSNVWTTNGPFSTGSGTRIINALAVSPDGAIYCVTGSGSVFSFTFVPSPVTPSGGDSDSDPPSGPYKVSTSTGHGTPVTVNVGGNSGVYRVIVTGTGHSGLIVTGTVASGPGQGVSPPPGTVFQYLDLEPARFSTIDGAVISFTVPLSWLNERNIDRQNVVLYHLVGSTWTALPAGYARDEGGQAYFTAVSPGFSRFAIAGLDLPVATVPVTGPVAASSIAGAVLAKDRSPAAVQTAVPAVAATPTPGFPFMTAGLIGAAVVVLVVSGFMIRRWWIRRQNPALFREYD